MMQNSKHYRFWAVALYCLISSISWVPLTNAEPHRLLGERGTYFRTSSCVAMLGMFPIDGGERVMQIWNERQLEDGYPKLFYQIIDRDGEAEFDPPRILVQGQTITDEGCAVSDREGNIFLVWVETEPFAPFVAPVIVQKFSPSGEPLWGGNGRDLLDLDHEPRHSYQITILPDERGGMYLRIDGEFIAVDENGSVRRDWQGVQELPEDTLGVEGFISDDAGGFWYEIAFGSDDGKPWICGLNHINYEGETLWEGYSFATGDVPEGGEWSTVKICFDGNGICEYNNENESGIYIIDEQGRCAGDEFQHLLRRRDGNPVYQRDYFKLDDGRILISYIVGIEPGYSRYSVWATLFDPQENEFPWGNEGVCVVDEIRNSYSGVTDVIELSDGDIICKAGGLLNRFSPDGQQRWDAPAINEDIGSHRYYASGTENTFWILGRSRPSPLGGQDGYSYLYKINLYDNDLNPTFENHLDPGTHLIDDLGYMHIWRDEEDNYRIIGRVSYHGLKLHTLDSEGGFVDGREGRTVLLADSVWMGDQVRFLTLEDMIIATWLFPEYEDYEYQDRDTPQIMAFDLSGELLWRIDLPGDHRYWKRSYIDLAASPNESHVAVSRLQSRNQTGRDCHPHVWWVDVDEGRCEWHVELPLLEDFPKRNRILVGERSVYSVFSSMDRMNQVQVISLSVNGNQTWSFQPEERLYFTGCSKRRAGGLWLTQFSLTDSSIFAWSQALINGRLTADSLLIYAGVWEGDFSTSHTEYFNLASTEGNLWIIPQRHSGLGVQCLTEEGDRLLGDWGFLPELPEEERRYTMEGIRDSSGGLWLIIPRGIGPNSHDVYVTHFNAQGELMEGWLQAGVPIIEGVGWGDMQQVRAQTSSINTLGDDLAVIMRDEGFSPFRFYANNPRYLLQVLSDEPRQDVDPGGDKAPETFFLPQVYPNPFNSTTTISFRIPNDQVVALSIYDLSGRKVQSIIHESRPAGHYSITFDGSRRASGVYVLRLKSEAVSFERKMILLK